MIVEGQVHGGLVDGNGMALMELIAFDEDGPLAPQLDEVVQRSRADHSAADDPRCSRGLGAAHDLGIEEAGDPAKGLHLLGDDLGGIQQLSLAKLLDVLQRQPLQRVLNVAHPTSPEP